MGAKDDDDHTHHERYPGAIRVKALESLLIERGFLDRELVDEVTAMMKREWRSWPGARLVARAWREPEFKKLFLEEPRRAVGKELSVQANLTVLENTATVHNVIACSLCSCYPIGLLGFPPDWYTSHEYRARIVREPRAVLREFGLVLPDEVEVRVWDSVADYNFLVLPLRPAGTEGLSEAALAERVTVEMVTGTAR